MPYSPHDLRLQLGMEPPKGQTDEWVYRKIRDWGRRGLRFDKDETGHITVHGDEVRRWIDAQTRLPRKARGHRRLPDGMMWCTGCNSPQAPRQLRYEIVHGRLSSRHVRIGLCARGHTMSQFISAADYERTGPRK